MASTPVLECHGLRRRFGDLVAVDGVGFQIAVGETYGLLGPNGAGKTTTISMIAGLLERDAGEVTVAGRHMTTKTVQAKSALGYVPQDLAIYPDLSGMENLLFFARLYGMSRAQARARAREVLARGVPFLDGDSAFIDELREAVEDSRDRAAEQHITEVDVLESFLHDDLATFIYDRLRRRPMVLPVVVEV